MQVVGDGAEGLMPDLDGEERLLASAVEFLADGADTERIAAQALARGMISVKQAGGELEWVASEGRSAYPFEIELRVPRLAFDLFDSVEDGKGIRAAVERAFSALMPAEDYVSRIHYRATLRGDLDTKWRDDALARLKTRNVTNQGVGTPFAVMWERLRFRSQPEAQIAKEFDLRGVLFFPNCSGRVGITPNRLTREPDFLVCDEGRWGILEVDGVGHIGRKAVDQERDRLFQRHGIKVVQSYAADDVRRTPKIVVDDFLKILKLNG